MNSALMAVRNVNQLITREKDREQLIARSCDLMVQNRGFLSALILLLDEKRRYVSAAVAGCTRIKNGFWDQLRQGNYPVCVNTILESSKSFAPCKNLIKEQTNCLPGMLYTGGGGYISRLEYEGKVYGVISAYVPSSVVNDREEQGLFQELARDIAYALASIERGQERQQLNQELFHSEERYRDLFENTSDLIQSVAPDGRILYTNNAWRRTLGYSEAEVKKLKIWDIIHADSMDHCMKTFKKVMAGEKVSEIEAVFVAKNGNLISVVGDSHCRFVRGKPISTQGIFRDVTERKRAEEALIQSEEKCKAIFERAVDGILLADTKTKKFFVANDAICRMLGYSQEEITNMGIKGIHPQEELLHITKKFEMQTKGETTLLLDIPLKKKDGNIFYADVNSSPVMIAGKSYLLGIFRDATERHQSEDKIKRLYSLQSAITKINEYLLRVNNETDLYQKACDYIVDVDFITFCWIGLVTKGTFEITPVAQAGSDSDYLLSIRMTWDESAEGSGAAGMAIKTKKPFLIPDFTTDGRKPWKKEALKRGFASGIVVPIMYETDIIGALTAVSEKKDAFRDEEVRFLTEVANDIAMGIKTLRIQEDLKRSFDNLHKTLHSTVEALAALVEKRDPYTSGHQKRVSKLACAIAREMGLAEEKVDEINIAALLHDIGKISIPAEVLSKPGKLTDNEFNMIKLHPQVSFDIINTIEFPKSIAQIVLQHHERLDGSGYPSGLSGGDIRPEARILAVADVVESMSSHRPYRPSIGTGAALEEISHNAGVLYDSDVVNACLRLFYEKDFQLG